MPNQSISMEKLTSPEVKSFINKYIPSVTHLNVLLLLFQNPHQDFSAKMIEEHLHLSSDSILKILSDLVTNKMASKKGENVSCYWYLPDEGKNDIQSGKILSLLNRAYPKNRSVVISMILKEADLFLNLPDIL
jgi:hypothetical protein